MVGSRADRAHQRAVEKNPELRPKLGTRGVVLLVIILAEAAGFAVSLAAVTRSPQDYSRIESLDASFFAWVTLEGEPVPSILALVFLVLIALTVAIDARLRRRAS